MQLLVLCAFLTLLIATYALAEELYVYNEDDESHFWAPDGYMPDGDGVIYEEVSAEECGKESGMCIKVGFDAIGTEVAKASQGWAGIYWLPSEGWDGPGINVQKALDIQEGDTVKLTFYAKGIEGGEKVKFQVGGVKVKDKDKVKASIKSPKTTKEVWVELAPTWKEYTIDLSGKDLSNVIGGFCWVTNKAKNPKKSREGIVWFFLDEIKYEVIK